MQADLTVILIGIPLTMIYNMESAMMQAVGNSLTPLLFLLLSSVLNIGLDVLFIMTGAWVYRREFREEPVQETCA